MPRVDCICEVCGGSFLFFVCPSNTRLGRGRFCSKDCQNRWQTTSLEQRFQRYIGLPNENGCIPWIGCTNIDGYGLIGSGGQRGHNILAHRLAYQMRYGPIPDGCNVLHSCDNPPCVNADHLFLGTHADNIADKVAKGRGAVGAKAGPAKLTDALVLTIRERYAAGGISQAKLGREYGVAQTVICKLIRRYTWKHV